MENIFKKHVTQNYSFNSNLENDIWAYLYDNLQNENYVILRIDLLNALTINANGEYI
jgi:hypothetical protein